MSAHRKCAKISSEKRSKDLSSIFFFFFWVRVVLGLLLQVCKYYILGIVSESSGNIVGPETISFCLALFYVVKCCERTMQIVVSCFYKNFHIRAQI